MRHRQALENVGALLCPPQEEGSAAANDVLAMFDEQRQHPLESQRARLPINQGNVHDVEVGLQRRVLVELVDDHIFIGVFAFSSVNKGELEVDLLFRSWSTTIPMAFSLVFGLGFMFGLACTALWALRLVNERRTLKRSLKVSESEVSSLRNLPLTDAD